MDFIIVTGLSGAGKSRAIDALEDIGFFCIDNMPPSLIAKFTEISEKLEGKLSKVAFVTDVRGGDLFSDFVTELDTLKANGINFKLLFLDCKNSVLIRRYKETRRKHPLIDKANLSIEKAVKLERQILMQARERADYIIDTSNTSVMQLKEKINNLFLDNLNTTLAISCMSFGFKYGVATEADLIFDVRCLPNPFYIEELKPKTGLDSDVSEYVMSFEQSKELLKKLTDLIDFLIPLYIDEGKSQLTIAFGCTGGKHRSVTFAENMYKHLSEQGKRVSVNHRDIIKS